MAKPFKYDVVTLIDLIKCRPCLWDKTLDTFKDRTEKQRAWNEIYSILEKDYYKKDKKERRKISEAIHCKWQNVRDAFVKSLKKKLENPTSRNYIYYDNLQFLLKVLQIKDDSDSYVDFSEDLHEEQPKNEETEDASSDSYSHKKKPRLSEDVDQEILKVLRSTKRTPDEDEAFFISITPTVRRMSEEDKLEFRMGVLQLIKDINSRSKELPDSFFSPVNSSSSSHPSTSFPHYNSNPDCGNFSQDSHLFKCE